MSFYDDASLIMYPSGYKEDKIYSLKPTNGTGDLTFSRASSATRVNAEGLIETASVLGAEEVTNGDFSADSDWTKGTGWSISAGSARFNSASTYTFLSQDLGTIVGNTYLIKLSCTVTSGDLNITLADDPNFRITTTGVYEFKLTPTGGGSSDTLIRIYTTIASSNTSIDNISVTEYTTSNVPRIDYSNGCGSLLLEPQRTNLVTYSESFDNAYWTKSEVTISANNTTSPDGTTNADKLVESSATSLHWLESNSTVSVAGDLSLSIYAKAGERTKIGIRESRFSGGYATFDLSNGTIIANGITNAVKIEDYGNGWYKISISVTGFTGFRFGIYLLNDSYTTGSPSSYTYTGNGTSGVYIYGAQTEQSSYPTSYIISNSGTSTTRIADAASKTGISSLINSTEGVLYAEIAALADDGTTRQIDLAYGSANTNYVRLEFASTSNLIYGVIKNTTQQAALSFVLSDSTNLNKIAIKYKANDFALWVNGVEVDTDTSGTTPVNLDSLTLSGYSGTNPFFGNCQNLMVFPSALTDDELADLTGAVHQTFNSLATFYNYTIL